MYTTNYFKKWTTQRELGKYKTSDLYDFFSCLLKEAYYRTSWFFFFLPLSSVTHLPIEPRYFLAFCPWETSGWVNMEKSSVNKIPADAGVELKDSPWPPKQWSTLLPTCQALFKKTAKTPLVKKISQFDEGNLQKHCLWPSKDCHFEDTQAW